MSSPKPALTLDHLQPVRRLAIEAYRLCLQWEKHHPGERDRDRSWRETDLLEEFYRLFLNLDNGRDRQIADLTNRLNDLLNTLPTVSRYRAQENKR